MSQDARKGNQFWKARATHGRKKIFQTPEQLWDAACEYFQWVEDNPLYESKIVSFQGVSTLEKVPLMRAMTMEGLTRFLGVNTVYFNHFESALDLDTEIGKDLSKVVCEIREVIKDQKFVGASAGLLNANIIARDLGLTDKKELSGNAENPLTMVIKEISGNTLGPSDE
jgi:hypothetical protein